MPEKLKELLQKVLDWWNKFTTKQKTYIIAAAAGVILALAIVITIISQPQYVTLINCETTKEASEVSELLEGEGLDYQVSDDGYQIKINKNQQSEANLLLGANDIQSSAYTIDNVTNGGFSTTESDKQKRYEVYLETRLSEDIIGKFNFVKSAVVDLYIPDNDGTLISKEEESSAWVLIDLDGGEINPDQAAGLAHAVAVAIGNKTDQNVVIMDTEGNTLFSGADNYTVSGTATSQLSVKSQFENVIKSEVRQVVLGTGEFDKVEVAVNLDVDFSTYSETDHHYYVDDGQSQGYLSNERSYTSESTNGNEDVPGTDSNGDTEYVWKDNQTSSSTVEEKEKNYLPSEKITDKSTPAGAINYNSSSISLAITDINVIREEDVKAQGLLDGITWDEYKLANAARQMIEIDDSIYDMVAKATGFDSSNISIVGYTEPMFIDKEGLGITLSDAMTIILIVVILGLLLFVVLRSMKTEKEPEEPEELTVETLLQSTPESDLEDISTENISETRRLVEKFVEENPEAAASLLRNWLGDDWG